MSQLDALAAKALDRMGMWTLRDGREVPAREVPALPGVVRSVLAAVVDDVWADVRRAVVETDMPVTVARALHVNDGFEPEFWDDEETERDLYLDRARRLLARVREAGERDG